MPHSITGVHITSLQLGCGGGQVGQHWPGGVTGIAPSSHNGNAQSTASQLGPPPMLMEPAVPIEPALPTVPPAPTEPPLALAPPLPDLPALALEPAWLELPPLVLLPPTPGSSWWPNTAPPQATAKVANRHGK
jgi:hypothetical protein